MQLHFLDFVHDFLWFWNDTTQTTEVCYGYGTIHGKTNVFYHLTCVNFNNQYAFLTLSGGGDFLFGERP